MMGNKILVNNQSVFINPNQPTIKFRSWSFQVANDFVSQKVIVGLKLSFDKKGHAWMGKQFCEQTDKEEALIIFELL